MIDRKVRITQLRASLEQLKVYADACGIDRKDVLLTRLAPGMAGTYMKIIEEWYGFTENSLIEPGERIFGSYLRDEIGDRFDTGWEVTSVSVMKADDPDLVGFHEMVIAQCEYHPLTRKSEASVEELHPVEVG